MGSKSGIHYDEMLKRFKADGWPKNGQCCPDDMGGSHYHCGHCGQTSSMMGHFRSTKGLITNGPIHKPSSSGEGGFDCPPSHTDDGHFHDNEPSMSDERITGTGKVILTTGIIRRDDNSHLWPPEHSVTRVIREQGLCGEISPDKKSVCILPLGHGPHGFDDTYKGMG